MTLLILLPPCRVRSQACRWSQGSSPPPHCLSQHHQPCSPSSSTLSTKGPRKLVLLARPANPVCQKRYPPARPSGRCHNAGVSSPSHVESSPQSSSGSRGLGLLLSRRAAEQVTGFPGKQTWVGSLTSPLAALNVSYGQLGADSSGKAESPAPLPAAPGASFGELRYRSVLWCSPPTLGL